ncbi:MAG TPA: hypothetical protein DCG39_12345 [Opitutae bacterium]|nr:hypothetical protein [Opitutae bacterium]
MRQWESSPTHWKNSYVRILLIRLQVLANSFRMKVFLFALAQCFPFEFFTFEGMMPSSEKSDGS